MHKGVLGGQSWQSVALRKDGSRAILWGDGKLIWLSATEFKALLSSEVV